METQEAKPKEETKTTQIPAENPPHIEARNKFDVKGDEQKRVINICIAVDDPQREALMRVWALLLNNHDRPREARLLENVGINFGKPEPFKPASQ